jgi:hypothetical protein
MQYRDIAEFGHSLHHIFEEMKDEVNRYEDESWTAWQGFARQSVGMHHLKGELRQLKDQRITERDKQIFNLAVAMVQSRMGSTYRDHWMDNLSPNQVHEVVDLT